MRRSTVLSFPLPSVFPEKGNDREMCARVREKEREGQSKKEREREREKEREDRAIKRERE